MSRSTPPDRRRCQRCKKKRYEHEIRSGKAWCEDGAEFQAKNMRPAQSFTYTEVALGQQLFSLLLKRQDVSVLLGRSEFSSLARKFNSMHKKSKENQERLRTLESDAGAKT